MPVEKYVENLLNGGSYSHLSPQCTYLSSGCIKTSQTCQKVLTVAHLTMPPNALIITLWGFKGTNPYEILWNPLRRHSKCLWGTWQPHRASAMMILLISEILMNSENLIGWQKSWKLRIHKNLRNLKNLKSLRFKFSTVFIILWKTYI